MRLGFSSILALHWTVAFAALAYGTVFGVGGGVGALLDTMGVRPIEQAGDGIAVLLSVALAGNFVFAALLFAWSCFTGIFPHLDVEGDQIDISRMAYGAGVSSMTILLIAGLLVPAENLYPAVAIQLAALAASYLACIAERLMASLTSEPEANDVRAAARLMALGAAHGAMLSRIAGRDVQASGGAS